MKNQVLFLFAPLKERIWGSTYFKNQLNITDQDSIGEMWSCSGYEGSDSIIENGDFKGETLSSLFKNHKELFNNSKLNEFPILVKLIATSDDLSVQVHPDDKYAREVENQLGKTEGWLILDADSSSNIVVGHRAKNKEELIKYVENDDYENLLIKRNVKKGDFFPIPSGTIHALGKGIVLLEVQQSSDVTYRFYDYHRKDKNGNERELHVQKAIDVTDYVPYTNQIFNCLGKDKCIVWDNQYFQVVLFANHIFVNIIFLV